MEFKEDLVIPLRTWQDELMGVTFVDVLGPDRLYSIKLPTVVSHYKQAHLLRPEYLLSVELVKTRKHWICKHVSLSRKLATPSVYADHTALAHVVHLILKYAHVDAESDLQAYYTRLLESNPSLSDIDLSRVEADMLDITGFLDRERGYTTPSGLDQRVWSTKSINGIG